MFKMSHISPQNLNVAILIEVCTQPIHTQNAYTETGGQPNFRVWMASFYILHLIKIKCRKSGLYPSCLAHIVFSCTLITSLYHVDPHPQGGLFCISSQLHRELFTLALTQLGLNYSRFNSCPVLIIIIIIMLYVRLFHKRHLIK